MPDLPLPEDAYEISVSELAALRAEGKREIRLIDCREDDEWHICRIEGAQLVPLSVFAERSAGWEANEDEAFVVY